MKFSVLPENFAAALAVLIKFLPSTKRLDFLQYVLVVANEGERHVTLMTTDLSTFATVRVGASIERPGAAAVMARSFADLVKRFDLEYRLDLTLEGSILTIDQGKKATIKTERADRLPALPVAPDVEAACITSSEALRAGLAFGEEAADEVMLLRFERGALTVSGRDGYRLHQARLAARSVGPFEALIEAKALKRLAAVLPKAAPVSVGRDGEHLTLACGPLAVRFTTRRPGRELPTYEAPPFHSVIDARELATAVKAAQVIGGENLYLRFGPDAALDVYAEDPEVGCWSAVLPKAEGDLLPANTALAATPAYLLDAISRVKKGAITLRFGLAHQPIWIETGAPGVALAALIMPRWIERAIRPVEWLERLADEAVEAAQKDMEAWIEKHADLELRVAMREREQRARLFRNHVKYEHYADPDTLAEVYR